MATQNLSERPFLTVKQVAEALSVNRNTVYAWIGNGELEFILLPGGNAYRIPQSAFEQFIDKISRSVRKTVVPCSHGKGTQRGGRFFEKGRKVKRITQKDGSISA